MKQKDVGPRQSDRAVGWFTAIHILIPTLMVIWGIEYNMNALAIALEGRMSVGQPVFYLFGWAIYNPLPYPMIVLSSMSHKAIGDVIVETGTFGFFLIGSAVLLLLVMAVIRQATVSKNFFGSAGFATIKELKFFNLLRESRGILLGQTADAKIYFTPHKENGDPVAHYKKRGKFIACNGQTSVLLFAPARSGKGVGPVLGTLALWHGSCFCLDIKAENWDLSAAHRATFSRVVRFDPTKKGYARYNPLFDIRDGEDAYRDAANMATMLIEDDTNKGGGGDGVTSHFNTIAIDALTGCILYMCFSLDVPLERRNLNGVLRFLSSSPAEGGLGLQSQSEGSEAKHIIEALRNGRYADEFVAEAIRDIATRINDKPEKERGSMFSTIFRALMMYQEPKLAENTATSDFSLRDFLESETPISLYITMPQSDLARLRNLIRVFITLLIDRVSDAEIKFGKKAVKNHLLFLLDEFPMLGKIDILEKTMGLLPGYGITFFLIAQSLTQLVKVWGKEHPFFDHCKYWATFTPGDITTGELIQKHMGIESAGKASVSDSGSKMSIGLKSVSIQNADTQRNLMNADEVMTLPMHTVLIFAHGMRCYVGKKVYWYEDARLKKYLGLPPPTPRLRDPVTGDWTGTAHEEYIAQNLPWEFLKHPEKYNLATKSVPQMQPSAEELRRRQLNMLEAERMEQFQNALALGRAPGIYENEPFEEETSELDMAELQRSAMELLQSTRPVDESGANEERQQNLPDWPTSLPREPSAGGTPLVSLEANPQKDNASTTTNDNNRLQQFYIRLGMEDKK